jgi:hypothetical protein
MWCPVIAYDEFIVICDNLKPLKFARTMLRQTASKSTDDFWRCLKAQKLSSNRQEQEAG